MACVLSKEVTPAIYIFGGEIAPGVYDNKFFQYILAISSFAQQTPLNGGGRNEGRTSVTMWATPATSPYNAKIWVLGGQFAGPTGQDDYCDIYAYDINDNQWSTAGGATSNCWNPSFLTGAFPTKRAGMSVCGNAAGTHFWFYGGFSHQGQVGGTGYNDVYEMSVSAGTYAMSKINDPANPWGITVREHHNAIYLNDQSFSVMLGDGQANRLTRRPLRYSTGRRLDLPEARAQRSIHEADSNAGAALVRR